MLSSLLILFFILNMLTEDQRSTIANAIFPISFKSTLRALSSTRTKETGTWLLNDRRFIEWKREHNEHKLLWLVGEREFPPNHMVVLNLPITFVY